MKKGFALLETIVVITFLSVSLLMLYKTFSNMIINSNNNLLYDDVTNIYRTYYFKEYMLKNNYQPVLDKEINILTCSDLNFSDCNTLLNTLKITKIYLAKYDLKEYDLKSYESSFNSYLSNLSNKGDYEYRLILEFKDEKTTSFASLGI